MSLDHLDNGVGDVEKVNTSRKGDEIMRLSLNGLGFVLILLTQAVADDTQLPEDWIEPHAWGNVQKVSGSRGNLGVEKLETAAIGEQCPKDEAHQFYRKLVNFLFDSSKLRATPDGDKMIRSVHLQVTQELLERLQEAHTAREIDSVVFEVIELSREGRIHQIKEIMLSYTDIFGFYLNEIYNSDTLLFFSFVVITLAFVWFVSRWMQRNIVLVFLLTIVTISYFLMYLDCNRRLEMKKLMELNMQNEKNPCEVKESLFSWSKYSEDDCFKHLMKSYGPQRCICGPTEVLISFFSHLTVTHIISFMKGAHAEIKDIFNNYSYTDMLIIMPFICIITYMVMSIVLKYSFKHIFPLVIRSINDHGESQDPEVSRGRNVRHPELQNEDSDRLVLSGESVQRLLTLLQQNTTVTLREAEGALETEGGDRVQALNNEKPLKLREGKESGKSSQTPHAITDNEGVSDDKCDKTPKAIEGEANPQNSL